MLMENTVTNHHPKTRALLRRRSDQLLDKRLAKYTRLIQTGQIITAELNVDALFGVISTQVGKILGVQRCSIFLIDEARQHLRPFVAADLDTDGLRLAKNHGIAGWVFCNKTPQIVNHAYADPRFCREVDQQTGFRTVNLICVPLLSIRRDCIGTMQALNKKEGDFTEEDIDILTHVASYVTVALENGFLYAELKSTDWARQKAVHHLSHELKTPLAILSTVMARLTLGVQDHDLLQLTKTINRGQRSLDRLRNIQEKVEDIVGGKPVDHQSHYLQMLEELISFIEEVGEDPSTHFEPLAVRVVDRIKSLFRFEAEKIETIQVDLFLRTICDRAVDRISDRNLTVSVDIEEDLFISLDRSVLGKICEGLLKNAIENTPDEGKIKIVAGAIADEIMLVFQDHGVGIIIENKKHIFKGFFHTQPTDNYSSKTPYSFNAGGTGTDLLRIKTYAERFGFTIDFSSRRCPFIPLDTDTCPGRVSLCGGIQVANGCICPGGSTFTVRFPRIGRPATTPVLGAASTLGVGLAECRC